MTVHPSRMPSQHFHQNGITRMADDAILNIVMSVVPPPYLPKQLRIFSSSPSTDAADA